MATNLGKIVADFSTTPTSKWVVWTTSGTLASATDSDGVALPSGKYFFTIDRTLTSKEYISATLSGTSLTSIKNVTRQGTEVSGTVREHAKSAEIVITDFAHIKKINDLLDGTTDLNSATPLKYDGTATIDNANHLATKKYVDDTAVVGAPNASTSTKWLAKLSVAPVSASDPISVGDNDPRVPTQWENDALVGTVGTPSSSNKFVTATDPLYTGMVKLTTDQTIAGIKTFSSIPILPASDPTTANQAVRKSYADSLVTETTGTFGTGGTFNKRGTKFYYNFAMANSTPSLVWADATTRARIATELGITISTYTQGTIAIGWNWTYYYYNGSSWVWVLGGQSTAFITSITAA